jgi:hypothetical protein
VHDQHRFHRWLPTQLEGSPAGKLWQLCGELRVDLEAVPPPGQPPTYADYLGGILGPLAAAWMDIEGVYGTRKQPIEKEVRKAAKDAAKGLTTEKKAERLFSRAWSSWRLYLRLREPGDLHK